MAKPYILALDLGTTGNRAIVFNKRRQIVFSAYREFPQYYPKPGWVEHDPEAIWQTAHGVYQKALEAVGPSRIEVVGITNQRETVVVWDRRTSRPVYPAIVWQCRRTAPFCKRLKSAGLEPMIRSKTGLFLDAYFSASKIRWILDHVGSARGAAARGNLLAGTIDSWILWKLSGARCHLTDSSNASRTMLFNLFTKDWDESLCRHFKIPRQMLGRIVPSSGIACRIAKSGIPVAAVVGDQQAAAFAQGCFQPSAIKNTYGTGLFMLKTTGPKPTLSKHLLTTVAWSIGDLKNTEYAVEGSVFIGGSALQWLRDGLGILRRASDSQAMATRVPSNEGVYFVPALVGLGAPYWNPSARGMIIGITRGTGSAHLARAALEAIAYQTRDLMEVIRHDTGRDFKVLRVDGGASANDFLMQFQSDILGITLERPRVIETTALGAAGLAGMACGFWKDAAAFERRRRVERLFKPKMKRVQADRLYGRWKAAVRRCLDWEK